MRTLTLKTKFPLLTFLAPVALMGSIFFASTGCAHNAFQSNKDGPNGLPLIEHWQLDEVDSEYAMEDQPRSTVNVKRGSPGRP